MKNLEHLDIMKTRYKSQSNSRSDLLPAPPSQNVPIQTNFQNLEAPTPSFSTLNIENKSNFPTDKSLSDHIHLNLKSQFSKKYGQPSQNAGSYHHKSMAQLDVRYGIEKLPANSYLSQLLPNKGAEVVKNQEKSSPLKQKTLSN